jgi:nitrite reductase/ring-hydroxylating ferredoxin subunit
MRIALDVNAVIAPWVLLLAGRCARFMYRTQEPKVAVAAYTISADTSVEVELSQVAELAEVGEAATIEDEALPSLLVIAHVDEGEYVAASSHCTHRNRTLGHDHDQRVFCYSSLGHSDFARDGTVVKGGADHPLRIYPLSVDSQRMTIELEE